MARPSGRAFESIQYHLLHFQYRQSLSERSSLRIVLPPTIAICRASRQVLKLIPPLRRSYRYSSKHHDYPKEGVFQPNSPPRNLSVSHDAHQLSPSYPPQASDQYVDDGRFARIRRFRSLFTPSRLVRSSLSAITALSTVFFGFLLCNEIALSQLPLPWPPGSEEDVEQLSLLSDELDQLPLVKTLRQERGVKSWREWPAYKAVPAYQRKDFFCTGPLAGSASLAAQKVFWNTNSSKIMVFVNFGEATTSWPGVVHGGAVSTVADETLGRVAMLAGVEDERHGAIPLMTAHLRLNYAEVCRPGQWYVFLAELIEDPHAKEGIEVARQNRGKRWVKGSLFCCSEFGPSSQEELSLSQSDDASEGNQSSAHMHVNAFGLFLKPKKPPVIPEGKEEDGVDGDKWIPPVDFGEF